MKNKLLIQFIYIILGGFFLLFPKLSCAANYQSVVFSELMWMGSHASSSDEWMELKNTTDGNIDLVSWQITYLKDGVETLMLKIPQGIIPAGGYFLISNNAEDYQFTDGQSILNVDPDLVDSSVTLSNSNLQLQLYDGQWNDDRLPIDIVGDGGTPLKGDNANKISMERIFPCGEGNLPESWQNSTDQEKQENPGNLDSGSTETANPHNSGKPVIKNSSIDPLSIFLKKEELKDLRLEIEMTNNSDLKSVTIDLSSIGGLTYQKLYDDGTNGDKTSGDNVYSLIYRFTLSDILNQVGLKEFIIIVENNNSLISNSKLNLNIYQLSTNLIINEIFPRPESNSQDEFMELYNRGDTPINLYGWQLDDIAGGGSKPYKILANLIINPQSYYTLDKTTTKIALNDGGDSTRLINPQGIEQAVVNYFYKPAKGQSYNFTQDGWYWSNSSTSNQKNTSPIILESAINSNVQVTFSTPKNNFSTKLANSKNAAVSKIQLNQSIIPNVSTKSNQLSELLKNNQVQPSSQGRLVYWINIIKYVILFSIVICIMMLGQFLWPKNLLVDQVSKPNNLPAKSPKN